MHTFIDPAHSGFSGTINNKINFKNELNGIKYAKKVKLTSVKWKNDTKIDKNYRKFM